MYHSLFSDIDTALLLILQYSYRNCNSLFFFDKENRRTSSNEKDSIDTIDSTCYSRMTKYRQKNKNNKKKG